MNLVQGAQLGPYRIAERLGQGGMATVYKAYHPRLDRHVAIKVMAESLAGESGFHERFQREARVMAKLRHPHILTVYDYGEEGSAAYLVAEFIEGGTLADRPAAPLAAPGMLRLLAAVAAALDYAHAQGVLHRDVKPANILIRRDGSPALADFGIAKLTREARLTGTGTMLGTPTYMAPEQAGGDGIGPASDQYALAVVAYELLAGRAPFDGDTPMAALMARLAGPPPPPARFNPTLGHAVDAVLLKALAMLPADRYPCVSPFTAALAEAGRTPAEADGQASSAGRTVTADLWRLPRAVANPPPGGRVGREPAVPVRPAGGRRVPPAGARRRSPRRVALPALLTLALAAGGISLRALPITTPPGPSGSLSVSGALPTAGVLATPAGAPTVASWRAMASVEVARSRLAGVAGPDGLIYAIGGYEGNRQLPSVETYAPSAGTWATAASLPTARSDLAAAVGSDGDIYAIGGLDRNRPVAVVEAYSPTDKRWRTAPAMPTARSALAAAAGTDGAIYAIGGHDGNREVGTVEMYTPSISSWAQVTDLPTARSGLVAVTGTDGVIYAIGGHAGARVIGTVEAYSPATRTWTRMPDMPTPRAGLAAAVGQDGAIYAIGGYDGNREVAAVEVFNPGTRSWRGAPDLQTKRSSLGAATGPDGTIYAFGGYDGVQNTGVAEARGPALR